METHCRSTCLGVPFLHPKCRSACKTNVSPCFTCIYFVHQICATSDITHQSWDSFSCSIGVYPQLHWFLQSTSTWREETDNTHAYSYLQLEFINFGENRNQRALLETALQQWKVPASFGPEHPEASQLQRLCGKHTTSCCAHVALLIEAYLWKEREKIVQKPVSEVREAQDTCCWQSQVCIKPVMSIHCPQYGPAAAQ